MTLRLRLTLCFAGACLSALLVSIPAVSDSSVTPSRMVFLERYDVFAPQNGPVQYSDRLVVADFPSGTNREILEQGSNVPEYSGLSLNAARTELGYTVFGNGWVRVLASGQKIRLAGLNDSCGVPRWSPDGGSLLCIGFEAGNYFLKFFDPSTLAYDHEVRVAASLADLGGWIDWVNNSTIVSTGLTPDSPLCTDPSSGGRYQLYSLVAINVSTGAYSTLFAPPCGPGNEQPVEPAVSPDHTTIAFGTPDGGLYTIGVDGSNLHQIPTPYAIPEIPGVQGPEVFFDNVWTLDGKSLLVSDLTQTRGSPLGLHSALAEINVATGARTLISDTDGVDTFAGTSAGVADVTPPSINCTPPDSSVWYVGQVTVSCSASDAESGLADPADSSFTLTTAVTSGNETNAAVTDSRSVCDQAGNCATAGPFGPFESDLSAPAITLARTSVDATSTAGVMSSAFGPSASDGPFDPTPDVSCSPLTVAIGDQMLDCMAKDQAGNVTDVSFAVEVRGAEDQLGDLLQDVSGLAPGKSLVAKVNSMISDVRSGDVAEACSSLTGFVNEVKAQAGKKLSQAQALQLIGAATQVGVVVGC